MAATTPTPATSVPTRPRWPRPTPRSTPRPWSVPRATCSRTSTSTISKLTGTDDPGSMVTQALDSELSADGLSYSEDIEPWLGARVGGFVSSVDPSGEDAEGAVAVAVTDTDAAQSFIDKARESGDATLEEATYNGTDYLVGDGAAIGISGDFMLIGTEQGFKDAVDAGRRRLARRELGRELHARRDPRRQPLLRLRRHPVDHRPGRELRPAAPASAQAVRAAGRAVQRGPDRLLGRRSATTRSRSPAPPRRRPTPASRATWSPASRPARGSRSRRPTSARSWRPRSISSSRASEPVWTQQQPVTSSRTRASIRSASSRSLTGINLKTDLASIGDVGGFVEGSSILGLGGGIVMETSDEARDR